MSNAVKNAIDTGLSGLNVTERDVAVIMSRVRTENQPVQRTQTSRRGLVFVLAAVMLAVMIGAGVRLMNGVSDQQELIPLTQPDTEVTIAPGEGQGFVPVGSEGVEPEINISAQEALAIAERYIIDTWHEKEDLRDGAVYEIRCEWTAQARDGNVFCANFYQVDFRALNEYATEYAVRVKADSGAVIDCRVQRGVGDWHTAQEIYAGYARVYGEDRRAWTQEQLRTYAGKLRRAAEGSHRWTDFLYMLSSYPDVPDTAITKERAFEIVSDLLESAVSAWDERTGNAWVTLTQTDMRARYISCWPNPVWKVAVDQIGLHQDGQEVRRTLLFEVDSVTGEQLRMEAVDTLYADWYESFTETVISAQMMVTTAGGYATVPEEEAAAVAADYIRTTWGETRDVNDPALFEKTELEKYMMAYQYEHRLRYTSLVGEEVTCYEVVIDWYGDVIAANRTVIPADEERLFFTPTVPILDWRVENLESWQADAEKSAERDDPAVRAFLKTNWLPQVADYYEKESQFEDYLCDTLGIRAASSVRGVLIDAEPAPVWKLAVESDQGNYLAEIDSQSREIISLMRVGNLCETWYLPFVLTADLQADGVKLTWDEPQNYLKDATENHGTSGGMRIDHLYKRFKQLYGPNMGAWTQEQLRSFQSMAILSNDQDYDMGVPCLRRTVYPDVPDGAISRTRAMLAAAEVIQANASAMPLDEARAEKEWTLYGGVLLGTENTPVWKICLGYPWQEKVRFWYAEVNCMTGEVTEVMSDASGAGVPGACYDDGTPANLWFRDIVREETIRVVEPGWDSRGNG